jgi:hypothetical protein
MKAPPNKACQAAPVTGGIASRRCFASHGTHPNNNAAENSRGAEHVRNVARGK